MGGLDVWCSILKEPALVRYIKYKLSGMKETQVVARMMSKMRTSDLTKKEKTYLFMWAVAAEGCGLNYNSLKWEGSNPNTFAHLWSIILVRETEA